jgi:hypothetical protein
MMNERIKQILINTYRPYDFFDYEKFAELIIEDVLKLVDETNLTEKTYTTYDVSNLEFCKKKVKENIINGYTKTNV